MTRIEELEGEIQHHDRKYWEEGSPEISDIDYDKLIRELTKLDPENLLLTKFHSEKVSTTGKVKHLQPMLSLNKVYTKEELISWCEKVARNEDEEFLLQYKFDGCSAEYTMNVLSTRGDGLIGENITDKVPLIYFINKDPKYQRGEILLAKTEFEEYKDSFKKRDGTPYSNPRNACAGLLNRNDNKGISQKILTFVPFDYVSEQYALKQIRNLDIGLVINRAKDFLFPTDGLVIKLADEEYKKSLGATSHHARGEMAFKFANDTAETMLRGVTWSSGKSVITPIGNVDPVEIGGVNVSNVSFHNQKFIKDMDIHLGDTLVIERAGDVIPHVIEVIPGRIRSEIIICTCPECGSNVKYEEPNMKCTNSNCIGSNLNKLYDSVRRIGIERLGKPTLREMISVLDVENLIDIFNIQYSLLLQLPRFGNQRADNLYAEIQKVKEGGVYEWQILAAMNIPGIGRTLSKTLCEKFGLNSLMDLCQENRVIQILCDIDGIEIKRAEDIRDGILLNIAYIINLLDTLPIKYNSIEENSTLQKVCFSGKFPEKKTFYYEKLNGKYDIIDKVNKDTDILVVADTSKGSSKQKKAEKMGIKIMSVDEIMKGK